MQDFIRGKYIGEVFLKKLKNYYYVKYENKGAMID